MGNPIAAEFELNQIEVIRPVGSRSFRHACANRERFLTKKISAEVKGVRSEILSGAAQILPAPTGFGPLGHEKRLVHGEKQKIAEIVRTDLFPGGLMNAHKSELVVNHDMSSDLAGKCNGGIRLSEAVHEWLFTKNMTACLKPELHKLEMGVGWGCHCKDMRLGSLQHFGN
jgi:hypothetical protein